MAAPSHCLNHLIPELSLSRQWHSSEGNFTRDISATNHYNTHGKTKLYITKSKMKLQARGFSRQNFRGIIVNDILLFISRQFYPMVELVKHRIEIETSHSFVSTTGIHSDIYRGSVFRLWGLRKPTHLFVHRDLFIVCVKCCICQLMLGHWDVARSCDPRQLFWID